MQLAITMSWSLGIESKEEMLEEGIDLKKFVDLQICHSSGYLFQIYNFISAGKVKMHLISSTSLFLVTMI